MKRGQIADYFRGVGAKRLSAVDAEPKSSNQHEIGTTADMRRDFLGEQHMQRFNAVYVWLGEEEEATTEPGWATHYDSRLNQPRRAAEFRLYYPTNAVTEAMRAGDTLFLALDRSDTLWFIVAPEGSTSEQQLFWLFDLRPAGRSFVTREFTFEEPQIDFAGRYILEAIGIDYAEPEADSLDSLVERFGLTFPKTAVFSQLARDSLPDIRAKDDPDAALLAWLDREEALFRRLERRIVATRLEQGFVTGEGTDVDGFISFSLGVQNRRKSRMGHSLENHIAAVLDAFGIAYERGAVTEHRHKPDFLFPGIAAYNAAAPGDPSLKMLGAKSSCKDRWRQVLAEAAKIPHKHLLTLEPGISEPQTDQMTASGLTLVIPKPIHRTYTPTQQPALWSVRDFINEVGVQPVA